MAKSFGPYTIDKSGRARKRGRFVGGAEGEAVRDALLGKLVVQQVNGQAFIRDTRGRRVSAEVAALQRGGPAPVIKQGNSLKRLDLGRIASDQEKRAPSGTNTGIHYELHFNSAPKLAGDNGSKGAPQYVKLGGKYYRVGPELAGRLQDLFLAMHDKYVDLFLDITESPQLRIPVTETRAGDLFDLDALETLDDEIVDQLANDPEAARAATKFNAFLKSATSKALKPPSPRAKGKAPSQGRGKPRKRSGKR